MKEILTTSVCKASAATIWRSSKWDKQADRFFNSAASDASRYLGPSYPLSVRSQVLQDRGMLNEAEELLRRVLTGKARRRDSIGRRRIQYV